MTKNKDITIEVTPIVFASLAAALGLAVIICSSRLSETATIAGFGLAGSLAAGGAGIAPVTNTDRNRNKDKEEEINEE